jgi:hypothetical protein
VVVPTNLGDKLRVAVFGFGVRHPEIFIRVRAERQSI